jgi:RNA polymerase sigma-70 factor (ECF subfamily)
MADRHNRHCNSLAPAESIVDPLPVDFTDQSDAELMSRVAHQDRAALGVLYDRHSGLLYTTILRIIGEPAEAQDVLHDTFLQMSRKASSYNPEGGRPVGWLITMARNLALDRVRMTKRRREILTESVLPLQEEVSGDEVVGQQDEARYLAGAVASLPPPQREALELAYFGGYTQEEISERLQQPIGTIKARIRRGLLKLRSALDGAP